ncbi:structural toxin protein RtxA [Legionella lansingensis]|uniref:Structural toxin protein RtxA n=1 Tax=Legionella lansingensis TaxID=45067 RepID=A0A0W0VZ73_9GAMM|nr:hypothetical protein [Legionella lansingensis]KTD25488.1 structural toxin protein RtxA [Legionella lansingensis]SNV51540.1 structural toxin protein RtxA [Legionella lansingensis]
MHSQIILALLEKLIDLAEKLSGKAQQALLSVIQKLADKFGIDLDPDSVVINGVAAQNETLSADLTNVDFDDGSGFSFQWLADNQAITNATQDSYTLTQDDVGKVITLSLTYTDVNGNTVVLTSDATAAVANVNDVVTGAVTIVGEAKEYETLVADTSTVADIDGLGEFAYQWYANGVAIAGANAANYTLTAAEIGKVITVQINYVDQYGSAESLTSAATAAVANVNDPVTGAVVIVGEAKENETLVADTSTVADLDGLGEFSYQWYADGVAIAGANAANYTLVYADIGKVITVQVSYADQYDSAESLTSAATAAVAPDPDATFTEPSVIELAGSDIYVNDILQSPSVQTITTDEHDDSLIAHNLIDGLDVDLGEKVDGSDNDLVDVAEVEDATYTASTGVLTDAQGNAMTIANAETFRIDTEGANFVLDQGGNYNFILAATANDYTQNPISTIKMIEGTGQTNVGIAYEAYPPNALPTSAQIQKINLQMEFNNTGPNADNVAQLNFAEGSYAFNATAIEYALIAALISQQLLGELKITLSDTAADPISGVTAKITGLRDVSIPVVDGDGTFEPFIIVDNQTGARGVADLTFVDSTDGNNPAHAGLNVDWAGGFTAAGRNMFFLSETLNNAPASNLHILAGFNELKLSDANDTLAISDLELIAPNLNGEIVIDLGERADGADNDIVDLVDVAGATYTASTGVLTDAQGHSMTITNADTFRIDTEGANFVLDQGGNYNFILAATANDYTQNPISTIKMIEGTGQTNVGVTYEAYPPNALPTSAQIQKLNLQMEFNNAGPNGSNVAQLNFAEGSYAFNATAIEYALIAALIAQQGLQLLGELKITLTDTAADPITGVTANITGLRDASIPVADGDGTFEPFIIVDNQTGVRGIADLTSVASTDENNPAHAGLFVNWDGGSTILGRNVFRLQEELNNTFVSNTHILAGFNELKLSDANDTLVISDLELIAPNLNGDIVIDLGERADGADNDVVDLVDVAGATYTASTGVLTDAQGHSMTITDADTFRIDTEEANFVLDQGGNYNFILAATANDYTQNPISTIKMIEGTGQTNVGIAYEAYPPNALPTSAQIQKINLQMEFNNTGPNGDNVAQLDFAEGSYAFNATAIEYALIAALIATQGLQLLGELKITLSDTAADPINGVTANITGLRDAAIPVADGSGILEPFVFLENQTGATGIADFSSIASTDENNPDHAELNVSWDVGGLFQNTIFLQEGIDNVALSNPHVLIGFNELRLSEANDYLTITSMSAQSNNTALMGDRADDQDHDILDLSNLSTGANYNVNGDGVLVSNNASMTITGTEEIIGTHFNDNIVGNNKNNTLNGGQGNDNLVGGDGNDELVGGDGTDTLTGGAGDDLLNGGGGLDEFVFGANSGRDEIHNFELSLGEHLTLQDVQVQSWLIDNGNTVVNFDANNSVTLVGVAINNINDILFA